MRRVRVAVLRRGVRAWADGDRLRGGVPAGDQPPRNDSPFVARRVQVEKCRHRPFSQQRSSVPASRVWLIRDVPPRGCGTAQPCSRTEAPPRASGTGARRAAYASRRRTTRSRIWSRATHPRHRPPGTAPAPGARRGGNRAPSSRPTVAPLPLGRVRVPTPKTTPVSRSFRRRATRATRVPVRRAQTGVFSRAVRPHARRSCSVFSQASRATRPVFRANWPHPAARLEAAGAGLVARQQ